MQNKRNANATHTNRNDDQPKSKYGIGDIQSRLQRADKALTKNRYVSPGLKSRFAVLATLQAAY